MLSFEWSGFTVKAVAVRNLVGGQETLGIAAAVVVQQENAMKQL